MGRPKGGTSQIYSKGFKLQVVKQVENGRSAADVAKEHGIHDSVVRRWVREYRQLGEAGLTPKRKAGNPLTRYQMRKELSEVERLEYELALAQMEIAELKKAKFKEWRDAQAKK